MVPPIDPAWNSTSSTQPQLPLWMPRPRAPEGEICSWRSGDSSRGRGLYEQTGCNWIVGFIWQYVYSIMQLCTGRGLQDQFHVPFLNISSLLGESMANKRCSSKIIQAKNIGTILLYIYIVFLLLSIILLSQCDFILTTSCSILLHSQSCHPEVHVLRLLQPSFVAWSIRNGNTSVPWVSSNSRKSAPIFW
jgi:hypothetical protein